MGLHAMILQDWWFTTLLAAKYAPAPPLAGDIKADILIIGGGMTGVAAAASFIGSGLKVVLLERNILGGSSTGRSAGFLTPDSELELSQLIRRFGKDGAREIWEVPCRGIDRIVADVERYNLSCDLIKQDSLFLGLGSDGLSATQEEAASRAEIGLAADLCDPAQLATILGGKNYSSGIRYGGTYGINALQYVQGMKQVLLDAGIIIHESTAVTALSGHCAQTHAGSVTADEIIVAIDKMTPAFNPLASEVFHAQTFLSISEPLSDGEAARLFPAGEPFQCWDSSLVYSYFRMTGDQRLLLGGGSVLTTYMPGYTHSPRIITQVIREFKKHFPFLADLDFIQFWPGLIDSTRDLLPVIVRDLEAPYRHFVMGCVGLPWASFAGDFVGRTVQGKALDEEQRYYEYFTDRRAFLLPTTLERVIGKPITFALNNFWAKYRQIDRNRLPPYQKGEF
jgi:gamma-glutamylputrescine oxidase